MTGLLDMLLKKDCEALMRDSSSGSLEEDMHFNWRHIVAVYEATLEHRDTGHHAQVTSAAVFSVMPSSQLEPLMRRLSEEFGFADDAIAVVFPRNQDEVLGELEAFERHFPSVPALANQATEFNVDGQYAPMSRLRMILLLIKLLH
ncbi:uncharacterized protein [Dermacentor andersoni]|uniref:uncharacterized protein n=1 Tax=Dermacentor andersoni TaxID=34620 RepID=UPI003B3AF144